jgi:hypothetical protein
MKTKQVQDEGLRRLPPALTHLKGSWVRIALSVLVAMGLGWALPMGAGGGLALAGATPVQHGHHGDHKGNPGRDRLPGRDHDGRSVNGTVTAILSGSEFTLVTRGDVTIDVNVSNSTKYTEPGLPKGTVVGFGNIAVGDRVQATGSQPAAGTLDATSVKIPGAYVVGTVQSVTSTEITLSPGRSTLTSTSVTIVADVSASTVFREPGVSSPSISDVLPGDVVKIFGTQKGVVAGSPTTLQIDATLVFIPLVSHVGVISNLGTSGFTLTSGASTITVEVTSATRYEVRGVASPTLANLANGDIARVIGNQEGKDTVSALLVRVLSDSHLAKGHHGRAEDTSTSGTAGHHSTPNSTGNGGGGGHGHGLNFKGGGHHRR